MTTSAHAAAFSVKKGAPVGAPRLFLAAAVIVVVAAVPVAAAIAAAIAAAAEEQQDQDDDPPAVVAAPVVTTHNQYLRLKFSERFTAHSMLFRRPIFVQANVGEGHCPSRNPTGQHCEVGCKQEKACHPEGVKRVEGSSHCQWCNADYWCEDPSTRCVRSG